MEHLDLFAALYAIFHDEVRVIDWMTPSLTAAFSTGELTPLEAIQWAPTVVEGQLTHRYAYTLARNVPAGVMSYAITVRGFFVELRRAVNYHHPEMLALLAAGIGTKDEKRKAA